MATYDTDLRLQVVNAADNVTGWSELATPHAAGAAPAQDLENFFHNAASVSQATNQATGQGAGFQYLAGSPISWTASSNWCFFFWTYYTAPTNIETWANGGLRVGVGDADNDARMFNAMGSDFDLLPLACWQSTAIDPEATADQTVGTVTSATTYQNFAILPNVLAKISKGSPTAADVIRYGRGQLVSTGPDCTFAGMATFNDNPTTGRYGLFTKLGNNYRWKGLMQFGDGTTNATMTQANINISVEDTPRVLAGFNKFEVYNGSATTTSLTWTNVNFTGVETSITGSAPVSPGDFQIVDNATISWTNCSFTDLGTFAFNGGTNSNTLTGCTFRRCKAVTLNTASLVDCVFDNPNVTGGAAVIAVPADSIDSCSFTRDTTKTQHAVDLGTVNTTSFSWNSTATDYAASDGSTGNEVIRVTVNAGQELTINYTGTAPSVKNDGTGTVTKTSSVSFDLLNLVAGSTIYVEARSGGTLTAGDIMVGAQIVAGTSFSTTLVGGQPFRLVVANASGSPVYVPEIIDDTTGTGFSRTFDQQLDE